MPLPKIIDVCKVDLFTKETELQDRYDAITVARLLRIRDEYQWVLANPDLADRLFVDAHISVDSNRIGSCAGIELRPGSQNYGLHNWYCV